MTPAERATVEGHPSRPKRSGAPVSRRELVLWLTLILGAGSLSLDFAAPGWPTPTSIVLLFAWIAMHSLRDALGGEEPATGPEIACAVAIGFASLLPGMLTSLAVLAYSGYLLVVHRGTRAARSASLLAFAIAGNQLIAPVLLLLFGTELNALDAVLVEKTFASGIAREGTVLFRDNGHALEVFSQCSSFNNISLGLLFWAAATAFVGRSVRKADALVGLLVAIALLAVNVVRLHLLAIDYERYAYWHYEYGSRIYAYVFGVTMVGLPMLRLLLARGR